MANKKMATRNKRPLNRSSAINHQIRRLAAAFGARPIVITIPAKSQTQKEVSAFMKSLMDLEKRSRAVNSSVLIA